MRTGTRATWWACKTQMAGPCPLSLIPEVQSGAQDSACLTGSQGPLPVRGPRFENH